MTDTFYITTPIYYVNDSPHIGHAYTTIAADVMARFMRLDGREVKFLTGTDEHGQKVAKSAEAKGIDPQSFTDEVSERFRRLVNPCGSVMQNASNTNLLNISNTDFIRTTEERHKKAAQALWKKLEANEAIYLDKYAGWYSVRDEAYYAESELIEKEGKKCAPTGAEVEWVEEESYFFKLSAYQQKLLDYFEAHPDFIYPQSRFNEVKRFVEGGLSDLSISRTTFDWGVPVPGNDKHIMYVWIDALTNYLTSCGYPDGEEMEVFWPNTTHIVGKDILRFHAVYWPAFLMAADLPLPKRIVAHGWWTIEGEKMSKSIGNVLSPDDMIEAAGGVDQLRYFMLRAMPFGNDGDFAQDRMLETVNADLANNIGNLAQRSLSMIQKNCEGKVPEYSFENDEKGAWHFSNEQELLNIYNTSGSYLHGIRRVISERDFRPQPGVRYFDTHILDFTQIIQHAADKNAYFQHKEPWKLNKTDFVEFQTVLYITLEALRAIGIHLQPFCPTIAGKLLDQLAVPEDERMFHHLTAEYALKPGTELPKPEPLFPRLEKKQDAA